MIDQISGYPTFSYAALDEHSQRISSRKVSRLPKHIRHADIYFQLGMASLRLGKWLLQFSSMPRSEIQSTHPFNG
jgi:hypothetical protein